MNGGETKSQSSTSKSNDRKKKNNDNSSTVGTKTQEELKKFHLQKKKEKKERQKKEEQRLAAQMRKDKEEKIKNKRERTRLREEAIKKKRQEKDKAEKERIAKEKAEQKKLLMGETERMKKASDAARKLESQVKKKTEAEENERKRHDRLLDKRKKKKEEEIFQRQLQADLAQGNQHSHKADSNNDSNYDDFDYDYSQFDDVASNTTSNSTSMLPMDPAARAATLFEQNQQARYGNSMHSSAHSNINANADSWMPPSAQETKDINYLNSVLEHPPMLGLDQTNVADFPPMGRSTSSFGSRSFDATSSAFVPGETKDSNRRSSPPSTPQWVDKTLNPTAEHFLHDQAESSFSDSLPQSSAHGTPETVLSGGSAYDDDLNHDGYLATNLLDHDADRLQEMYRPDDDAHHAFVFFCNESNEFEFVYLEPLVFGTTRIAETTQEIDLVRAGTPLWVYNRVSKFVFGVSSGGCCLLLLLVVAS